MSKNLVIVESPAKAETIKKYLGKDYEVKSSYGHIRDLPRKKLSIDIENGFKPQYETTSDKKKVVTDLRKAAKDKTVWLASDEDREGEAIAWHLCQALKIDPKTTNRIVFHEITEPAIKNAIKKPRVINEELVEAQQARRILDRIVGYQLSPVLWKKIRPGLSAGRVQSVAVRLIVEREREIQAYTPASSFKVSAEFNTVKQPAEQLRAELKTKLDSKAEVLDLLKKLTSADFHVTSVEQKPSNRNPAAPFTTSSLQQEAARKLGFSVRQTMTVAQRLYESGLITYMRTDSTTLSKTAIDATSAYITSQFGKEYYTLRQYKTKQSSAQEAHEAIRPTDVKTTSAGKDEQQQKLYSLIWKRTVASQMSPARTDKTNVSIKPDQHDDIVFVAKGEVLRFDGFLKVYGGIREDVNLPDVSVGDALDRQTVSAEEAFSKPPARYSEASLVKKLEDLGIGRPSTYAPTISTIQARGYVEKADIEGISRKHQLIELVDDSIKESEESREYGSDKSKLLPTSVALVTTDFLMKHFSYIVDYEFTANAEARFDEVAAGKLDWVKMLDEFYETFAPLVEKSESVSKKDSMQAKKIGVDPANGKTIYARFGRYGPMLQRGETEDDEKPDFAPMPEGKDIETVTFDEAMEMFKLPRIVGQTEDGQDIKANIGRFGPYIQVDKTYVAIKPRDPMKITIEESRKLYAEKLQQIKDRKIQAFANGIEIIKGPYGPYVTNGKKNVRIPKNVEPKDITEKQAQEMIDKAPTRKKRYKKKK